MSSKSPPPLRRDRFYPRSGDDWRLDVSRFYDPDKLDESRRPVAMVPGYAMNTFILGFHPTGRSMVDYLVERGFEIWTANLRGQGDSRALRESRDYGFAELADHDLPAVHDLVLDETYTDRGTLNFVGCSIGVSYIYAYLARHLESHRVGGVVAIGGPLRWEDVHPALRLVFSSSTIASALPTRGTRLLARAAIPLVKRLPPIASIYMNVHQIELERAGEIVQTIDDPNPRLNRQIAHWIDEGDLVVDGTNVTRAMEHVETPILCILANHDGIVPAKSVLSIRDHVGTDDVSVLRVGDDSHWFAHADLFISEGAESQVFVPLGDWLEQHDDGA